LPWRINCPASGTYEELLKHVKRLVLDNELREAAGKNAYEYAMEKHSMKNAYVIIDIMNQ